MAIGFQGTIVSISEDGETYQQIGCLLGYDRAGASRNDIDITCADDEAKKFLPGLKDNGTLSIDLNYEPESAGWAMVLDSEDSNENYHFKIEMSNKPDEAGTGSLREFQGYVNTTSDSGAVDDKVSANVDIKITGAITRTAPVPGP